VPELWAALELGECLKMPKVKALAPVKAKGNIRLISKSVALLLVEIIFWAILLIGSFNVVCYYSNSIKLNGWLDKETFNVSIYLIIGAYFFLILNKKQIYEALGIKTGLSYMQSADTKGAKCQKQ
jgi:hypothetical protein